MCMKYVDRQILLVFGKDDQQMDILANTARRLGWSVSVAIDAEKAIEFFQSRVHELVIIDRRGQSAAEGDAICRYDNDTRKRTMPKHLFQLAIKHNETHVTNMMSARI